jgi:hypothetical protein
MSDNARPSQAWNEGGVLLFLMLIGAVLALSRTPAAGSVLGVAVAWLRRVAVVGLVGRGARKTTPTCSPCALVQPAPKDGFGASAAGAGVPGEGGPLEDKSSPG